jgi:glycosyltransferase involved in cell wall biosynthesis
VAGSADPVAQGAQDAGWQRACLPPPRLRGGCGWARSVITLRGPGGTQNGFRHGDPVRSFGNRFTEGGSIRIAFVHSFYSSHHPSGENGVVESEVHALREAGHEVLLVAGRTDELGSEPLYRLRSAVRVMTRLGRNPLTELRAFGPDVVHIHNLYPNFGRIWVREVGAPIVATLHNYRLVCANGILFRDGGACLDCVKGSSVHAVEHACYRNSRLATMPLAVASARATSSDPVIESASRIVVLSDRMRSVMRDVGVQDTVMVTWPNFVPRKLEPEPTAGRKADGSWLYVGRLTAEKGISRLVDRWPSTQRLTIVGDGPLLADLRDRAPANVNVRGRVSRPEVLSLMRGSKGLVFPSLCFENFPLIYPEALASALPVLAFEGNAVADVVALDGTGWVVAWNDDLGHVLEQASAQFVDLEDRCRRTFEQRYNEETHVDRAVSLYREVIDHPRPLVSAGRPPRASRPPYGD